MVCRVCRGEAIVCSLLCREPSIPASRLNQLPGPEHAAAGVCGARRVGDRVCGRADGGRQSAMRPGASSWTRRLTPKTATHRAPSALVPRAYHRACKSPEAGQTANGVTPRSRQVPSPRRRGRSAGTHPAPYRPTPRPDVRARRSPGCRVRARRARSQP